MKRFFDAELETFRSDLLRMGEVAVRQVRDTNIKYLGQHFGASLVEIQPRSGRNATLG